MTIHDILVQLEAEKDQTAFYNSTALPLVTEDAAVTGFQLCENNGKIVIMLTTK